MTSSQMNAYDVQCPSLKHGGVQPLGTEDPDHVNTCRQYLPVESQCAPVLVINVAHEEAV